MSTEHDHDELEAFRAEARALGFSDRDGDLVALESADDFIARMRSADRPAAPRPAPSRWVRRAAALTVAVAAATALVVVLLPTSSPASADTPPVLDFEFAAATRIAYSKGIDPGTALANLSSAAARTPDIAPTGSIQFKLSDNWFSDTDESGSSQIVPRVSRTWLRQDGSLRTQDSVGRPLRADGRGLAATSSSSTSADRQTREETLPKGSINPTFVASLPTDASALSTALLDHAACESRTRDAQRSMCLYREIISMYQTYVVPPKVSAAVWAMLQSESGFELLGSVKDRAGRDGIGISIIPDDQPDYRFILIANPDNGELLGAEEILIKADPDLLVDPPAVTSFSTYVASTFVDAEPR